MTPPLHPLAPPPAEPRKVPLPLVLALVVLGPAAGILAFVAALRDRTMANDAHSFSYAIGAVAGSVAVLPLIACGIAALFRAGRNPRVQMFIIAALWGLAVLVQLPKFAGPSAREIAARDEQLISELQGKLNALGRQAAESTDMAESARLQAEMKAAMEAILPQLSPRSRTTMAITLKVVNPIFDDSQAYARMAGAFMDSGNINLASVTSQSDFAPRREGVAELSVANAALMQRIENVDEAVEDLLKAESLSARERTQFLTGFKEGMAPRLEQVRIIRNLDQQFFDQYLLALGMLEENWGRWEANADGAILWETSEQVAQFNGYIDAIQQTAAEQQAAQRKAFGAPTP